MNTQPKATNPILKLHPKQSEAKKVSVDDGFIQIPRRLFLKLSKFGFTQHQQAVINAVIIKCLGFHKEIDWISNPQIVELTSIGYGNKASTAKQELIRMNVLVQKGNSIGFNMNLDEWKKDDLPKQSNIYRNGKNKFTKTVNDDLPKQSNTKETITKEKINNTPIPPKRGESQKNCIDEKILAQANELLAYYNDLAKSTCRSAEPFFKLLQKTTGREAYAVDDIKIVIRWALSVWKSRTGKPKPENICRVKRFDGYLADATAWAKYADFDTQAVIEAYNDILGERLIPIEDDDDYAAQQILDLLPRLEHKTVSAFKAYFQAFANNANPYYFEPERKIGFSFLMKPETLMKTRRGEI